MSARHPISRPVTDAPLGLARWLALALAMALALALCLPAPAAPRKVRTPDEAQALVHRVAEFLKQNGRERTLAELNNPKGQFVDGELYVFAYDTVGDGVLRANVAFPLLVGKNLLDLTDPEGVPITRKVLEIGASKSGKGWLDYQWPNAMNGKFVELKTSYVERAGSLVLGCGIPKSWAAPAVGAKR